MSFHKFILAIVISFACLSAAASAQQIDYRPVLTGLVLEVQFIKDGPLSYESVPWFDTKFEGSWYGRFGQIPGWQLPAGALPVRAVRITPSLKGDTVTIKVSVLRGRYHDVEDRVSTHHVRENEKITIEALKDFGVVPFEIEVIRVVPATGSVPSIINKTQSLDVVDIQPRVSNLPRVNLTIHNRSAKNVRALTLDLFAKGRKAVTAMPQGVDGQARIEAGGYFETPFFMGGVARSAPRSAELSSPADQHLVISLVVFEDDTYEGDPSEAAEFLAFALGRRIELKRILPVLEAALNGANDAEAPNRLRSSLQALSFETEASDFAALFATFPALDRESLSSAVRTAIHGLRRGLLNDLQACQNGKHAEPADFRAWLTAAHERYSAWFARENK
jgi:hypothetical protein